MYHPFRLLICLTLLVNLGCGKDETQAEPDQIPDVAEKEIVLENAFPNLSFQRPLDLQHAGDDLNNLYIAEQGGRILVIDNDSLADSARVFLDISSYTTSGGELGLLGLAFHPEYNSNGQFYLAYTPSADLVRISRFSRSAQDPLSANPDSESVVLEIGQPYTNHNGGQLIFGQDGLLYISSGDGGSGGDPQGNAQNLGNLLGKILRIDINTTGAPYDIPNDNPFLAVDGARPEIYAYGLRNPWRMSFDPVTGHLWAADVGQGVWEEIDLIEAGGNYGWNIREGSGCYEASECTEAGLINPVFEYNHDNGDRSVTGGFVYRGSSTPSLVGKYIYADYVSGRIWAYDMTTDNNTLLVESGFNISSFGTDAGQELFICTIEGDIFRLGEQ